MPEGYQSYLPLVVLAWTVVTFFAGHFIGHRAAVKRDKRKEYNSLVSPVRVELLKQVNTIENNDYELPRFKRDDIIRIGDLLKNQKKLMAAYSEFKDANSWESVMNGTDDYGQPIVGDTSRALSAAKRLLKEIPLK
ncbi:hypothetical protein [Pantoea dispersa]|uniref:hypothetical protein n=1 Tax=Pantoea dispersa TaxID=59814 RepID=UPI003019D985